MKRFFSFILMLAVLSMSCNFIFPNLSTNETPVAEPTLDSFDAIDDIKPKLTELGGAPCAENEELTCVTIQVPLDHYDSANAETLDVVFGVLPASGERYGMFVQAFPGGPGGEGISTAYWDYFDESVLEHFDIVYYDQRGLGLSSPLECPVANAKDMISYLTEDDTVGLEGVDTPEEQQKLIEDTRTFTEECIAEMGIDPAKLSFYGTDQVAEDIEDFRALIGDEKFWLYGVSYGTAVGQTYAYAYPDRLAGLILDGTIDMTLPGEVSVLNQEKAFDKVLVAVLNSCNDDEYCLADMNGEDALKVYDEFAIRVSENPIPYEYPLANSETVKGTFTFNQFEYTAAYQMYALGSRIMFLKALAAANNGDMTPMLRLMYDNATIDPATYEYIGDPNFSDTMFLSVLCTDDTFFSGTPEERINQSIEAGQASNGTVPRLDGSIYTGVSCALWPSAPKEVVRRQPLVLEGVPVFVLNAKLDPATPFEDGENVFKNLANGYHLYAEGGIHAIFGWGKECPDNYVTDFLVNGTLPREREIVCEDWGAEPADPYIPNLRSSIDDYADVLEIVREVDNNLYFLPEYYYGDAEGGDLVCNHGGTYTFVRNDDGETYTFDSCEMLKGFVMNGSGSFDANTDVFTWELNLTGDKEGSLTYIVNYATGKITLNGEYGGETIALYENQ